MTTKKQTKESMYVHGWDFDQAIRRLWEKGFRLVNLREEAELRMAMGEHVFDSHIGTIVRQCAVSIPNEGSYITNYPLILKSASKATKLEIRRKEFYLTDKQVTKALEDSVKVPDDKYKIHVSEFGEEPLTNFCFGDLAKDYGHFLKSLGKKTIPIGGLDRKKRTNDLERPCAHPLYFQTIFKSDEDTSDIGYMWRRVLSDAKVRGVFDKRMWKARLYKSNVPYTYDEVMKAKEEMYNLRGILRSHQIKDLDHLLTKVVENQRGRRRKIIRPGIMGTPF
jgi:hypothetical protein